MSISQKMQSISLKKLYSMSFQLYVTLFGRLEIENLNKIKIKLFAENNRIFLNRIIFDRGKFVE